MQELPLGIQDFTKLRTNNLLYVDKTQIIHQLINSGQYHFISRPRRFGKSLLVSTLRDIFLAKKELFKGLWIEDKIDWEKHNVIHFSFGKSDFKETGLLEAISKRLQQVAKDYDIELIGKDIANQFENLIKNLAQENQVVILIDEYDKPIIEYLGKEEIPKAYENRSILKTFYSVLKDLDSYIRFFLITGVSKFSKVSIFSDLNNVSDISMHPRYATLLGYTQKELESYFEENINHITKEQGIEKQELLTDLKKWYNGYDFVGENQDKVYNPFSILSFMESGKISNYWFSTGTPTFLTKMLKEQGIYDVQGAIADEDSLGKFELDNLDAITVLFQTGYLTLEEKIEFDVFTLNYPNQEVKNSMFRFLLAEYAYNTSRVSQSLVIKLKRAFNKNDIDSVFEYLNALFAKIPYQIFEEQLESYYHSIIFLTFTMLGYYAKAEVQTSKGRIDAVVETEENIYILEFKVSATAEEALSQIKETNYFQKYKDIEKNIFLIGVACKEKELKEYLVEKV